MPYLQDTHDKVTTERLRLMKQRNQKICCITAYDGLFARIFEEAGVDLILVGDSLANVFQGKDTTLSVTLEEIIYHTKIVKSAVSRPLVVADMPFMTFQINPDEAVRNAGILLKETECNAVKLEGASNKILQAIEYMTEIGIPVMGHIGLTPQSINKFGTYRVRGKDLEEAEKIYNDAIKLEKAGCFAVLLEKIPATLSQRISQELSVPTIGIGAGQHCDGQILVCSDMLGLSIDFNPRFVRKYANLYDDIRKAVMSYTADVQNSTFPNADESY
ncbi:MAG: 3-methyl-2-oxobutanoate hydroxymethyltransferase [Ignavibacteria bacterium]|jgi:3-methyl-2-oxobutanoate hydroxymethyltransferase|nr:3-methyl-2-oxobutanoate hydroxymethyltransferase [Ignavibacteria bacterium]